MIFSAPTRLFAFLGVLAVFTVAAPPVRAEMHGQSASLFWLDVPEGWLWTEDQGQVTVSEFDGSGRIVIRFEKVDGVEEAATVRQLVFDARDERRREVADRNGKSVMKVERRIDGVFALQTGFLIFTGQDMRQATSLVFFQKGHLFDIYFEAPREVFRLEMERIVDTWSFTEPQPEEPEEGDGKT